jgi:hypothetical protein
MLLRRGRARLLSGDETEQQPESTYDKLRQTTKVAACIGKAGGCTCKTCSYRSYCDGIPEDFWAYELRIKAEAHSF